MVIKTEKADYKHGDTALEGIWHTTMDSGRYLAPDNMIRAEITANPLI